MLRLGKHLKIDLLHAEYLFTSERWLRSVHQMTAQLRSLHLLTAYVKALHMKRRLGGKRSFGDEEKVKGIKKEKGSVEGSKVSLGRRTKKNYKTLSNPIA